MNVPPDCKLERHIVSLCKQLLTLHHPADQNDDLDGEAMISKLEKLLPTDVFPSVKGWIEDLLLLSLNRLVESPPGTNPGPNDAPHPPPNQEDTNRSDPWLMSQDFAAVCNSCPKTEAGSLLRVNLFFEFTDEFKHKKDEFKSKRKETGREYAPKAPVRLVAFYHRVSKVIECVQKCYENDAASFASENPKFGFNDIRKDGCFRCKSKKSKKAEEEEEAKEGDDSDMSSKKRKTAVVSPTSKLSKKNKSRT